MSSITLLFIFVTSFVEVIKMYSLKPTITGAEFESPVTAVKYDFRLFPAVGTNTEGSGIILIFASASILASAVSYCGKDLSIKELLQKAEKSWKRPFVTWLYITLLRILPLIFFGLFEPPLMLIFTCSAFAIVTYIIALVVGTYLNVFCNLALVVSVLEEKCGIEAHRKAGQLIKGSKLRGFCLNLVIKLLSMVFSYLYQTDDKLMPAKALIIPLLFLNCFVCVITMISLMAHTVLYYECKAIHGGELELQGRLEFTKVISSTPLIDAYAV
ncbi:hypothetical protein M0R45_019226 [Rubus argutus]